jgi:hypothetical protein
MIDESDSAVLYTTIDALRIVADYTSIETYILNRQLDALVAVEIDENMQNPLDIDFFINDGTGGVFYDSADTLPDYFMITQSTTIAVEAYPQDRATSLSTSVDKFEWFIDGYISADLYKVGENLTPDGTSSYSRVQIPGSGFGMGAYSLSVLVTKDGTLSSRSIQLIVE